MAKKKPAPQVPAAAPEPTASPPALQGQVSMIEIGRILPSPTNPRKHFSDEALSGLADSIRSQGVLQALLVRPAPGFEIEPSSRDAKDGYCWSNPKMPATYWWAETREELERFPPYELVAGERRWRAAKIAGCEKVPCMVRYLTDLGVAEAQVVENEQREDVSPLEKAYGYAMLVEGHGVRAEDLAVKVGKSASTIRNLMRLRHLAGEAREALEDGSIPVSTGLLIARIPNEKERAKASKEILAGTYGRPGEPMNYAQAKQRIESQYMVELKGCTFNTADENLVPEAGSCDKCPHRTGNNPDWGNHRGDICTDPPCFRRKLLAVVEKQEADAEKKGNKVMPRDQAKCQFLKTGGLSPASPYIDLASPCFQAPNEKGGFRTWQEALGKLKEVKKEKILAHDNQGQAHWVLTKHRANELLTMHSRGKTVEPMAPPDLEEADDEAGQLEHEAPAGEQAPPQADRQPAATPYRPDLPIAPWAVEGRTLDNLRDQAVECLKARPAAEGLRFLCACLLYREDIMADEIYEWCGLDAGEDQQADNSLYAGWLAKATEGDLLALLFRLGVWQCYPSELKAPGSQATVIAELTGKSLDEFYGEAKEQLEAERTERKRSLPSGTAD